MATQPTQNAIPSESPRDLKFNAGKIDEFVTSMAKQYIDRFGQAHYTIEGIRWLAQQAIAAFGWIPIGTFQSGANLTLPNQILKDTTEGEYYRWDGNFPKEVPNGSTPQTAGGIGVGKWLSVGDASLRLDLSRETGASLVGYKDGSVKLALDKILTGVGDGVYSVDNYGAKGTWSGNFSLADGDDDSDAFQAAFNACRDSGGGTVICSAGKKYRITRTIFYPGNCIFDMRGAKILLNAKGEGSAFLPYNFQQVGPGSSWSYIENVVIRNGHIDGYKGNDWGNAIGVIGARNVVIQNIKTDWFWFHQVDGCAAKDLYIDNCIGTGGRTAFWQIDSAVTSAAVAGVDANGNAMPIQYDPTGASSWSFADNVHISRCNGQGAQFAAVHIHNYENRRVSIYENLLANNQYGIWSDDGGSANEVRIFDNFIFNNTINLNLLANHRNLWISRNEVYGTGQCLNMRGETANDSRRRGLFIQNNLFTGGKKSIAIGHYKDVMFNSNRINDMSGDPASSLADLRMGAVNSKGWVISIYGCYSWEISGNYFSDCTDAACVYTNGGNITKSIQGIFSNNRCMNTKTLGVISGCNDVLVNGNMSKCADGSFTSLVVESCDRANISNNSLVGTNDEVVLGTFDLTVCNLHNNQISPSTAAGQCVRQTNGTTYSHDNNLFTGTVRYRLISGTANLDEPYLSPALLSKAAGTMNYVNYTTTSI